MRSSRTVRPRPARHSDEGSALILALVVVLMGSLIVTPLLGYARGVTRASRVETSKTARAEAVKGGLRAALASPKDLYKWCTPSGLHQDAPLPTLHMNVGDIESSCTTVNNTTELTASELRMAMATVQVGSAAPIGTVGAAYAGSGDADINKWLGNISVLSTGGKILLPQLPSHALTHPSPAGYLMPSWAGDCRVFFPGTYTDPITISSSQPVFFTSGIYYFENTLTFTGNANVVVGGGSKEGCTTDQDAAYNAINAPANHNISGYGTTFVFGAAGRLVVNDSVAGSGSDPGPKVTFNSRLVADTDIGGLPSRGVSIVSVDGVWDTITSSHDLNLSNQLFVPKSIATGTPAVDAAASGYKASTLVPVLAPGTQSNPIIDFSFAGTSKGSLWVPGYVSVPQGRININVAATATAGTSISLLGGVLAALFTQGTAQPATQQLGIVNRVVQKTFKIVSRTCSICGSPIVVSTALVQINDYGEYVVNSWDIAVVSG